MTRKSPMLQFRKRRPRFFPRVAAIYNLNEYREEKTGPFISMRKICTTRYDDSTRLVVLLPLHEVSNKIYKVTFD